MSGNHPNGHQLRSRHTDGADTAITEKPVPVAEDCSPIAHAHWPIREIHWPDSIDTRRFLTEYWQRQPLLIPQALPGFRSPLSPDELAGLALEEDTTPRLILRDAHGRYSLEHGPFKADRFDTLGNADWSLLVTDVEKHLPELAEWLAPFRFLPAWRFDDLMISYAPDGASVGAHVDEYDVFLLQASGRRRWEIGSARPDGENATFSSRADIPPDEPLRGTSSGRSSGETTADNSAQAMSEADGEELRLLPDFVADQSWVLEPGDLLYLPPGVPHHGTAIGDDCMTWSIGFRAPAQLDIVEQFSALLTDTLQHRRFQDPVFEPLRGADAAEISSATVLRFAELWADAIRLDPTQLQDFVGRLVTANPLQSDPVPSDATSNSNGHQPPAMTWTRHPFSRFAFVNLGHGDASDRARLFVDGEAHDCSTAFARRLCDPADALISIDMAIDQRESALLNELARSGKIEPKVA